MANRSDRRLPNLLVAQAHHEAAYVIEVKTRGFHQDRTRLRVPQKVGYMPATGFSQPSADSLAPRLGPYMLQSAWFREEGMEKCTFREIGG
jgi:hypothetical protein